MRLPKHIPLRFILIYSAMCIAYSITAAVAMLFVGSPMIAGLKRLRGMKWSAREDTPDTHLKKQGTPSMGGIGIGFAAVAAYLGCRSATLVISFGLNGGSHLSAIDYKVTLFLLVAGMVAPIYFLLHLALGFRDDWLKATGKGGLRARSKFLAQCLLALAFIGFHILSSKFERNLIVQIPGTSRIYLGTMHGIAAGPLPIFLVTILLVGTCNAVNIADGIDGLAAGLWIQCGLAFVIVSRDTWSAALAGACLGFLAFNRHPARVFMGDTGSLALGAALGSVALFGRAVFLLPFVAFIFYVELFSVAIQVLYFKYTRITRGEGVRLFRRAPLHHHFELAGWSEWRVVLTFWGVNLLTSILGLVLWELRYIPRFP